MGEGALGVLRIKIGAVGAKKVFAKRGGIFDGESFVTVAVDPKGGGTFEFLIFLPEVRL